MLGGLSSVITEPMEGAYNDGLAGFFKGQMVHPQNVQLPSAQLQNVQDYKTSWIQNVHLPNTQLQNIQDTKPQFT